MRFPVLLSLGLALFPAPGHAHPPTPASVCDIAAEAAARAGRVPPALLHAIALVETGRPDPARGAVTPWPWTVTAEGVGRFYDSAAEAVAAVRALQARGVRSVDVGCLQVNLMYHPDAFASLEEAFDPARNAAYAARFLNQLHEATHDWAAAAAAYHSQTPEVGADYQRRVLALWPAGARAVPVRAAGPALGPVPSGRVAVMLTDGPDPVRVMALPPRG